MYGKMMIQHWEAQKNEINKMVAGVIHRAQAAGTVHGNMTADILAGYLLGMIHTRFINMPAPEKGDAKAIRELIALFCRGANAVR